MMTSLPRVSTSQRYETLLQAMQQNKARVARAEAEIATGLKADIFADGAGKSGLSLDLRHKKELVDTYLVANAVTAERQATVATLLANAGSQVLEVRNLLLQPLSWQSDPAIVQQSARAALDNMVNALNANYGGTFLFAGRASDTPPYVADGNGGYVYQADTTGDFTAPIGEQAAITVAPRGNAPALADSIAQLSLLASADLSAMNADDIGQMFQTAMAALSKGYDGITQLEGQHGNNQNRLDNMISTQRMLSLSYNNTIVAIEGVDPEEAAIQLKKAQIQLDSTFAITAQMANLSLLKHL